MVEWRVAGEEAGTKLVTFLRDKLGEERYSARQLKKGIESNLCTVNGKTERFASVPLGKGNVVFFDLSKIEEAGRKSVEFAPARILYEDEHFLAYDKPSGVTSDAAGLVSQLKSYVPAIELIHRLDKDTSGVILFAKSKSALEQMIELFRVEQIQKTYLTVVDGVPKERQGTIENWLGRVHQYEGQSLWGIVPRAQGKRAFTRWKQVKGGDKAALIRCHPETGRTHQIRVHMSGLGHPILGDGQYGKRFRCPYRATRCLLHAERLEFTHPITGNKILVEAPLPGDFKEALSTLKLG